MPKILIYPFQKRKKVFSEKKIFGNVNIDYLIFEVLLFLWFLQSSTLLGRNVKATTERKHQIFNLENLNSSYKYFLQ